MRKSIDGFYAVVEDQLKMDPSSSALFLLCGRKQDRSNAIFREPDGFVLLLKKNYYSRRFLQCPIYKGFFENLLE